MEPDQCALPIPFFLMLNDEDLEQSLSVKGN